MKCIYLNPILEAGLHQDVSFQKKVSYTGNNTGNMVFVDAIKQQLIYEKEVRLGDPILNEIGEDYIGVLSCANMINISDPILEAYVDPICDLKFSITLAGLGAQGTKELNTPHKLMEAMPKERIRALLRLCERVVSIGIRGEFTAECLELVGIRNYHIIGCPSLYQYEENFRELKQPHTDKCVFYTATKLAYEHKILEFAIRNNMKWILQSMTDMPLTVYENRSITDEVVQRNFPGYHGDIGLLEKYMRKNAVMFFRMKEWYEYLEKEDFTFSFGGRFHGNVAAMRSGIPALWIVHDSRTKELTQIFDLPSIDYLKLSKIKCVEELIDYCSYEKFYKKYPRMFHEYNQFLKENGIDSVWKRG